MFVLNIFCEETASPAHEVQGDGTKISTSTQAYVLQ